MKTFLAIALLLWSGAAVAAGEANLQWFNPTTYTDGSSMPMSDIASLKILYGKCADGHTMPATVSAATVAKVGATLPTGAKITGLDDASKYCFGMTTVSVANGESALSNVGTTVTNPHAPPSPPSAVTLAPQTVYMEVRGQDRFSLVAVGTVPAGVQCDMTQSVNGHFVVPNSAVQWSGNVRPPVVVAKCS